MAPGEGDTWHARCHTHKQHVIYVEGGGHVGGVIQPPPMKATKRKKRQKKKKKWRGKSQKGRRLCVERIRIERFLDQFIGGEEQKRKEKKEREKIKE